MCGSDEVVDGFYIRPRGQGQLEDADGVAALDEG
jgi:hypothetical protein